MYAIFTALSLLSFGHFVECNKSAFTACVSLDASFPGSVYGQNTSTYEFERQNFWSNTSITTPSCVFLPENASDVAHAITTLSDANSDFAVRAIGHMPNPGYTSLKNGVQIVFSRMRELEISSDHRSVSIGPGLTGGTIQAYLGQWGLVAVTGRYSPVGATGVLLGGGISHFGGQHGWASNNILEYELVTANGSILTVNNKTHTDLFWALKGGANNYGIVTRFKLATYYVPQVFAGTGSWSPDSIRNLTDAVKSFVSQGGGIESPATAISPVFSFEPDAGLVVSGSCIMVHAGSDPQPTALQNFTTTANNDTAHVRTYVDFLPETDSAADGKVRDVFSSVGLAARPEAIQLFLDTLTPLGTSMLKNVSNAYVGLAPQPISTAWLTAARAAGGDPMDLDPQNGNFILLLIAVEWTDPKDDATVYNFVRTAVSTLKNKAEDQHLSYPFLYMNDAGSFQDPFQYFGAGRSLARMQAVRQAYDPHGVFQKLLPGGFKLSH